MPKNIALRAVHNVMNRDLVIIESPGKLKTLHRVFGEIGLHANICATIGHFLENPTTLKDLAIEYRGGEFVETKRLPFREDSYRYLCDQIRACTGRILVATDNDQEGHVIAQDVAALIAQLAPARPLMRMLVGGLDKDSIVHALANLCAVDPAKAVPGTARRISDRLIGARKSDFENNKPVGRVQSAILGVCGTQGLPHTRLTLKMPCTDGGKPFLGEVPIFGATTPAQLIAELDALNLPTAPVIRSEARAIGTPLSYGDALLDLHRSLNLDIADAADLLQRMYESGDISYPRTGSQGLTDAGIESAARIARVRGLIAFKKNMLPLVDASSPHEAIRVLNEERLRSLDIGKPLKLHDADRDAALCFVARRTMEAGLPIQRDYPELSRAPEWARGIEWTRDTRRAGLPWRYPEPQQIVSRDIKAALVEAMMQNGIGRPSTYASHAARFAERALLNEKFELTPKGREWFEFAPVSLKHPGTSARIEALLETETAPIAEMVGKVLEMVADDDETADLETLYAQFENTHSPELSEDVPDETEDPEFNYRPAF